MNADDIRSSVQKMRLTTPEAELLACIAMVLVEILESVTEILESVDRAAAAAAKLAS